MLPVLFDFKFLKIYTFGIFLVLAFFWGSFVLWRLIRLTSYKEENVFDCLFYCIYGSLLIGRLMYVIVNFSEFGFNIFKFVLINGYPGFSLYGLLIGAFATLLLWCTVTKNRFEEIIDYFVPPLTLAIAIGKLGAFISGSEIGTRTTLILGVKYANMDGLRHLTPLYESIAFFTLFYITYRILFEIRKERFKYGFNGIFFVWTSSLILFLFDNIKQYRLYFLGFSLNTAISGILLLTFSFYFLYYFRSPIRAKIGRFINFVISYVKSSIKKFPRFTKKENRGGTSKHNKTDRKS